MGKGDAVEDGIEPAVPSTVQAVAHVSGRRGLKRCHSGVGRELRVGGKAMPRAQDASQSAGREKVDTTQPRQWSEVRRGAVSNPVGEFLGLCQRQSEALR